MGRFLFLSLLLLSAGVAVKVAAAPAGAAVPRIGIVSAIGDKLYLRKIGITAFGNETQELVVDSWRLDDLMTAKIRTALTGRFDVRPVTYQRSPFASLAERNELFSQERRPELVRTGVSPQGLDGYLVITKSWSNYDNTNQSLLGLGIVERSTLLEPQFHAYANYALAMVDGRNSKITEESKAFLPPKSLTEVGGITRKVDKSFWPASPDAVANQRLKGALAELIDKSLPCGLQRMRLIPPEQACDMTIILPGRD
jgi:hypothetical protein